MPEIIAANDPIVNSYQTDLRKITIAYQRIVRLTKVQILLLLIFYEDHISGIEKSERDIKYLCLRAKKGRSTVSKAINDLEREGFMKNEHGGSNVRKRWITREGFIYLENQHGHQIAHQTQSIPYIDLSEKELINYKILNDQQKEDFLNEEIQETKIAEQILEKKCLTARERMNINNLLNRNRIGSVRTSGVISRFVRAEQKKPIKHAYAYLKTCFEKEEREMTFLFSYFKNKNVQVNMYDM